MLNKLQSLVVIEGFEGCGPEKDVVRMHAPAPRKDIRAHQGLWAIPLDLLSAKLAQMDMSAVITQINVSITLQTCVSGCIVVFMHEGTLITNIT